jgi:hypothetical protein
MKSKSANQAAWRISNVCVLDALTNMDTAQQQLCLEYREKCLGEAVVICVPN